MTDFKDEYEPTFAEEQMARGIDTLVNEMLYGGLVGLAVCAITTRGQESFFYFNKPEVPILEPVIEKLLSLFKVHHEFSSRINAPSNNRSYRSH